MEVIPMSRNRRYNPYRDQSYKKDFETENKIDLDDKNEVTTDKEVNPIDALMSDKKTLEDMEVLQNEGPTYFEKIEHPKQEIPEEQMPKFVKGIVKVLSNMRSAPSMEAFVLEVLPAGTSIMIYQDTPGDFYKVVHDDVEGFIKKDLCARVGFGVSHLY